MVKWYNHMARSSRGSTRRSSLREVGGDVCSCGRSLAERSPNHIRIKIPGKMAYRCMNVSDDEKVSSLKKRMAENLGVDIKNWNIYAAKNKNEAPKIVDDDKRISQIDHNRNLYFYPRIVI